MVGALALVACASGAEGQATAAQLIVYIGTYTKGTGSEGIYVYHFNSITGELTKQSSVSAVNPSFLAVARNKKYLYSVGEISGNDDRPAGGVSAFAIAGAMGSLTLLNAQSSGGKGPCHLVTDVHDKMVLVANYGSGDVAALPILGDGSLGPVTGYMKHAGSGPNEERQKEPHAHSFNVSPDNKYAYAADLGIDKILIYRLDTENSDIQPNPYQWAKVAPGAGPRHLTFHPNGKFVYVINELNATITGFGLCIQQTLYFFPLPHGQGAFLPILLLIFVQSVDKFSEMPLYFPA
jgi:6-phosphogluconolactonase